MNNLLKIGISQETIDKMIDFNGIHSVAYLNRDYKDAYRVIDVLKQLLIDKDTIDLLLINMIDLFSMDYNTFISKIKDRDLREVSDLINDNYMEAFKIFLS